jgi:formylglycine-generating enzyme required for sulfatase activity
VNLVHHRRALVVVACSVFALVAVASIDTHAVAAPKASTSSSGGLAFVKPSKCPGGMVLVPGGTYTQSATTIGGPKTIGALCVDVTEVTVAAYATCSASGACTPAWNTCVYPLWDAAQIAECGLMCNAGKSDRLNHPVNCVDYAQSSAYCASMGKRLPEQDEWEWIARGGTKGSTYPWGDTPPDTQVCWSAGPPGVRKTTCEVASFASGDNPQGIHDLAGNVQEWTKSKWPAGVEELRLTKGGTWAATSGGPLRVDNVNADPPLNRHNALGFRCVKDA